MDSTKINFHNKLKNGAVQITMSGLVKWGDPFFRLPSIVSEFENYFNKDFFGSTTFDSLRYISTAIPMVNAYENDKEYVMEVLAPKLNKEDLVIEVEDRLLKLVPNVKETEKQSDDSEDRLRKEYNFTYSERTFKLPENVDTKKIEATAENGIITIRIPKKEPKTAIKQQILIK